MAKKAPTVRDPSSLYERENRAIIERLNSVPLVGGRLLVEVGVNTAPTRVAHGLGRPYLGYLVVKSTADVSVWVDSATDTAPDRFISLDASASATISLWVF